MNGRRSTMYIAGVMILAALATAGCGGSSAGPASSSAVSASSSTHGTPSSPAADSSPTPSAPTPSPTSTLPAERILIPQCPLTTDELSTVAGRTVYPAFTPENTPGGKPTAAGSSLETAEDLVSDNLVSLVLTAGGVVENRCGWTDDPTYSTPGPAGIATNVHFSATADLARYGADVENQFTQLKQSGEVADAEGFPSGFVHLGTSISGLTPVSVAGVLQGSVLMLVTVGLDEDHTVALETQLRQIADEISHRTLELSPA